MADNATFFLQLSNASRAIQSVHNGHFFGTVLVQDTDRRHTFITYPGPSKQHSIVPHQGP